MGGAKFMGRDCGLPQSKELDALLLFFIWLIGGLFICFLLSILIFPTPNFIVPISVYVFGVIFLWIRYVKAEKRSEF